MVCVLATMASPQLQAAVLDARSLLCALNAKMATVRRELEAPRGYMDALQSNIAAMEGTSPFWDSPPLLPQPDALAVTDVDPIDALSLYSSRDGSVLASLHCASETVSAALQDISSQVGCLNDGVSQLQRRHAAAARMHNHACCPLVAKILAVDSLALLITSFLGVADQCRTHLVSHTVAAICTHSLRSLRHCTLSTTLGAVTPDVCTFLIRCCPALRSLHIAKAATIPASHMHASTSSASGSGDRTLSIATRGVASPSAHAMTPLSASSAAQAASTPILGPITPPGSPQHLLRTVSAVSDGAGVVSPQWSDTAHRYSCSTAPTPSPRPLHGLDDVLRHSGQLTSVTTDGHVDVVSDNTLLVVAVHCPGLTTLSVPNATAITPVGLSALRLALNLTCLNLSGCTRLSEEAVVGVLRACQHLEDVNLSNVAGVTDGVLDAVAHACPKLRTLRVSWCRGVTDSGVKAVADRCSSLSSLHVAGCLVSDTSVGALTMLVDADVSRCRLLRDGGVAALARNSPFLSHLNLSACGGVTNAALRAVAGHCHGLRSLDLSMVPGVTDAGVTAVASCCPRLTRLNLSGCAVSDDCLHALASHATALVEVNLSHCKGVTGVGLEALVRSLPTLQTIHIARCEGVTPAALAALRVVASDIGAAVTVRE